MSKIAAIVCAIVLAFGFQAPPTPSLGGTPQGYTYRTVSISPRFFPILPQIPWPIVHVINQNAMHVKGSPGAPPPDLIKFTFVMNGWGFYYLLPVTNVITLGPENWLLKTPYALTPHLLPGFVTIRAVNSHTGIMSRRVAGIIE